MRKTFLILILLAGPVMLRAQTALPTTYSYSEDPALSIIAPTQVTLHRDGPKEFIEQVIPPSPGRPTEFRSHILYDFQAHKIWTKVLSEPGTPCSVMEYASSAAPAEFDFISGGADLVKEFTNDGKNIPQTIGKEVLNGIPTTVEEVGSPQGKGKIWLADQGGFPVKVMGPGADGKLETIIEIKQLSFAKPPASVFTPPAGCQAIGGEATANGVHAEIGGDSGEKTGFSVTNVTLKPIPNYIGACPAHVTMMATITTDGPGTVWYQFGAGQQNPGKTVKFTAAGTQTVSDGMTFTVEPKFGDDLGASAAVMAVMEDKQGGHALFGKSSNNSDFSVHCRR